MTMMILSGGRNLNNIFGRSRCDFIALDWGKPQLQIFNLNQVPITVDMMALSDDTTLFSTFSYLSNRLSAETICFWYKTSILTQRDAYL